MNELNKLLQEAKSSVGQGWWPIIEKYLQQMVELAPEGEFFFKEKYGTLRMRVYGKALDHEKLTALEMAAEHESATVCEKCGDPGRLRDDRDWIKTLCDSCLAKETEMNIIIEPNFWVKLKTASARKTGGAYSDWRAAFVGKEGCLSFRYYSKTFQFEYYLDGEEPEDQMISGRIEHVEENGDELNIRTNNSKYAFKIIKKTPNEDTTAYYAYLMNKE
ncbi:MAG: hypothetical protein IJ292_04545 [Clostridia bacterium]|nr:hypothetical protein [Clostridia bacterium]